ncbi:MAG: hypothetical protein KC646_10140 [Candidatus Cloacimonetes bacterium]|nr:hypothetical protein [Candidatus Cloacimonadota bacterium]
MDKSLVAEDEWLRGQIKYLAECFSANIKRGRINEMVSKMEGMPKHHAQKIFRDFIDTGDKFPLIKDIIQRVSFYKNVEIQDLKRLEEDKTIKPKYENSLLSEMMIEARPMKVLYKKDPQKFNKIKAVFEEYFPNTLSQATDENSSIDVKDLRVNACFSMMNEFYTNPMKVLREEIEKHTPGVVRERFEKGLKICQKSKDFFLTTAKCA